MSLGFEDHDLGPQERQNLLDALFLDGIGDGGGQPCHTRVEESHLLDTRRNRLLVRGGQFLVELLAGTKLRYDDVTDRTRIDEIFSRQRPSRVFHAAAYKHVPMLEEHPLAAVHNNVIGTWLVAKAAGKYRAERFILVSTDKAVRPANVMGATKRIAEQVTLHLQDSFPETAFGAVRFGNVLGSNGSVITLFKSQLEAGEPLTVTHEDVTRFFMTIPEAVQLILQASLLPKIKGGIAMLEMGRPVPILELAKNLLRLSGKGARVGRDIVITGLRPGEKLHEELAAPDEKAIPTGIEKVTLLDTSVAQLPDSIADAIEEERIEDVMTYLRAEIIVVDPEAEVALDGEKPLAQMVGSD